MSYASQICRGLSRHVRPDHVSRLVAGRVRGHGHGHHRQSLNYSQQYYVQPRQSLHADTHGNTQSGPLATNEQLYGKLLFLANHGEVTQIKSIVHNLLRNGEPPSERMYELLIRSQVSPEYGSAQIVQQLLAEVGQLKMPLTSAMCHAALKALSVHVDPFLRADIVEYMQQHSLKISGPGRMDIAVGQLREGSLESALLTLEENQRDPSGVRVPLATNQLLAHMLIHSGDLDAALEHMSWTAKQRGMGTTLWRLLLDMASEAHHYAATASAWKHTVATGLASPSTGTLVHVLGTAAQHGDKGLALAALDMLKRRRDYLVTSADISQVIDAHLGSDDVDMAGALGVIVDMAEQGVHATKACTRPFFMLWKDDETACHGAWQAMLQMRDAGRSVPIVLLNALLEAFSHHSDVDMAVSIFDALDTFVPANDKAAFADTDTFATMYQAARLARERPFALCMSLKAEQDSLRIPLGALCYDRLILVCTHAGRLDAAIGFLDEMSARGWSLRRRSSNKLTSALREAGHARYEDVLARNSAGGEVGGEEAKDGDSRG